jgi:hypothetical protein
MKFNFAQNTEVDALDVVPEEFRPLYAEKEAGGYALKTEDETVKGAVAAILGLNKALVASRAEAKEAKSRTVDLSALSDYGESVDEIAAGVQTKLEELETQVAGGKKAKLDLDKVRADLGAAHAKQMEAVNKKNEALTSQLHTLLITNDLRAAIGDRAINADLVLPFAERQMRVVDEDGTLKAYVVNPDGTQRFSGVTAQPMTGKELIEEMAVSEAYAPLFRSNKPDGGGTPPGSPGRRSQNRPTEELSANEKIARGLAARERTR